MCRWLERGKNYGLKKSRKCRWVNGGVFSFGEGGTVQDLVTGLLRIEVGGGDDNDSCCVTAWESSTVLLTLAAGQWCPNAVVKAGGDLDAGY